MQQLSHLPPAPVISRTSGGYALSTTSLPNVRDELYPKHYDINRNMSSMAYPTPAASVYHPPSSDNRPMYPPQAKLQSRGTFIDNPFNGFTATQNTGMYDVPPISVTPVRPLQSPTTAMPPEHEPPPRPLSAGPSVYTGVNKEISSGAVTRYSDTKRAPALECSVSQFGYTMIGTTGLKNLGNTCYMNSVIQCLSATIPLARYLISGAFKQHINKNNPLGTGGTLIGTFANLLRVMWSETYNFVSPMSFREAIVRFAPQFQGTDQHDSQEFLTFLLDGLHEDLNLASKKTEASVGEEENEHLSDYQASCLAWERYLARNASMITSTTYNAFMSLSLPIPSRKFRLSSATLYECLDHFLKEETLDKRDAWHCPRCKKLRRASKQLTLSRLPDILLIHLKRFSFDGPFRNKLDTMVQFPLRGLDLSSYVPSTFTQKTNGSTDSSSFKYDLYAVSNHYGSLSGGHYTACVRTSYRGEWQYFDDTHISTCEESKVATRAAYNLFYVRSTVKYQGSL
ncbi:ubiquitin-specific protease doa4 [Apophysomyces ossiformis]|uniref:Ubiquitin carboxyl-terminal hydrolase n=1 Tax=Apophysomyces ossiformis TaxID=679940 RepID=A0A8H7BMF0_9FUNG|nr:ubiquitin-specific protease doa4 [Apophysomyces ossiformis]